MAVYTWAALSSLSSWRQISAFPKLRDASGQHRLSTGLQRFFKLLIPNWDTGNFLFVLVLKKYLPFVAKGREFRAGPTDHNLSNGRTLRLELDW